MLAKAITDFMFLWSTIDPIGTVAIFAALTHSFSSSKRRFIARKASLYAAAVLVGSIVLGQMVLSGMGIRMISLQVAGGAILFLFALKMIFSEFKAGEAAEGEEDHDIAVFPLAIPAIATPGAIMAAILITDNARYSIYQQGVSALMLLLVLLITYWMMVLSERILKIIGKNGASIMVKIMGMLLAALSVELIMEAIGIERWLAPN